MLHAKDASYLAVPLQERYVCGVTHKPLRNAVPCCVLRKTGLVITLEAYERLVKPGTCCNSMRTPCWRRQIAVTIYALVHATRSLHTS
jgi:hypothetical protein